MTIKEAIFGARELCRAFPETVLFELQLDGSLRRWEPGELFDPDMIAATGIPRKKIAERLDEIGAMSHVSRHDGLEGLLNVESAGETIFILIYFRPVQEPDRHGPWMSFGAAFLHIERGYTEWITEAFQQEYRQLLLDSEEEK